MRIALMCEVAGRHACLQDSSRGGAMHLTLICVYKKAPILLSISSIVLSLIATLPSITPTLNPTAALVPIVPKLCKFIRQRTSMGRSANIPWFLGRTDKMQLSYAVLLVAAASSVLARRLVMTPPTLFSGNSVYIYSNDGTEHAIKDFRPIQGCKYNRGSIGECCMDWAKRRAHFKYKGQSTKYCFKFHNKTGTGKNTRWIFGEAGCSW